MGFRSGLTAGHGNMWTSFSIRKWVHTRATWGWTLSCWNTARPPTRSRKGNTTGPRISFLKTKSEWWSADIAAQTTAFGPPCLSTWRTQASVYRLWHLRQTLSLPSALKHRNFVLSLKATWDLHRCRVQHWWVWHQATQAWRCLWVSTDLTSWPTWLDSFSSETISDCYGRHWPVVCPNGLGCSLCHWPEPVTQMCYPVCAAVATCSRPDLARSLLEPVMR